MVGTSSILSSSNRATPSRSAATSALVPSRDCSSVDMLKQLTSTASQGLYVKNQRAATTKIGSSCWQQQYSMDYMVLQAFGTLIKALTHRCTSQYDLRYVAPIGYPECDESSLPRQGVASCLQRLQPKIVQRYAVRSTSKAYRLQNCTHEH